MRVGMCIVLFALARGASGQVLPTVAAGLANPGGAFGERRHVGPLARFGLTFGKPDAARQFRLDAELAHMPGEEAGAWTRGDMTSQAIIANFIGGARGITAPYLLFGVGLQRLNAENTPNPYGNTLGARVGVGFRSRSRGHLWYVESAAHLNVTDYGSREFNAGYFFPIVAGIRY